jgi:serine/threonine-protein kinase RsbT
MGSTMTKVRLPDSAPISSSRRARGEPPALSTSFNREVFAVLLDYLSAPDCRSVIRSCEAIAEAEAGRLGPRHLPALLRSVERALNGFGVSETGKAACLERLRTLGERALVDLDAGAAITVSIERPEDILHARRACRNVCRRIGFSDVSETKVVTAISELVRIILERPGEGRLEIRRLTGAADGIELVARAAGSGIAELAVVLNEQEGARAGIEVGLVSAHRLMDHLEVASEHEVGSTLIARKLKG